MMFIYLLILVIKYFLYNIYKYLIIFSQYKFIIFAI